MILADTSAVVQITRDKSGRILKKLRTRFPDMGLAVTPLTELEVLRGARDERHWARLKMFLAGAPRLGLAPEDWEAAARIDVEMRWRGLTVNDPFDFCIAQAALSRNLPLLHRDRDFEKIRVVRESLRRIWLD